MCQAEQIAITRQGGELSPACRLAGLPRFVVLCPESVGDRSRRPWRVHVGAG